MKSKFWLFLMISFIPFFYSTAPAISEDSSTFRVVTYNIAMGLSMRLQMRMNTLKGLGIPRSLRVNRHLKQPSVFSVQEICTIKSLQPKYLERALSAAHGGRKIYWESVPDSTQPDGRCNNGQATFSIYPIVSSQRLELPMVGARTTALVTDIDISSLNAEWNRTGKLRVYNAHLSNRSGKDFKPIQGRWKQAEFILANYEAFRETDPNSPVIFLGDFNSLGDLIHPRRRELTIINLMKIFEVSIRYYVATLVLGYQIDWIFYDKMKMHQSKRVLLPFSDHFPVVADF